MAQVNGQDNGEGWGVQGESTNDLAVLSKKANFGVWGIVATTDAQVRGVELPLVSNGPPLPRSYLLPAAPGDVPATGVFGASLLGANTAGVVGENDAVGGVGVSGLSYFGFGVHGVNGNGSGATPNFGSGIWGESDNGYGVYGGSITADGVFGEGVNGVHGKSSNASASGTFGENTGEGDGVRGTSANGVGVHGIATSGTGVLGQSSSGPGVIGLTPNGNGVEGRSSAGGAGVLGSSNAADGGIGVRGFSAGEQGAIPHVYPPLTFVGAWGEVSSSQLFISYFGFASHVGVYGDGGPKGVGIFGKGGGAGTAGQQGLAAYFVGNVAVTGNLSKAGGGFRIDHPLDPARKFFNHSFVESSERKNFYDGVVILDSKGAAVVKLPNWFEEINGDFRYQLTPIGAPAPNLHIARKIDKNQFAIDGGTRGMEVAWQVTAIRKDPWAKSHPITVEEEKNESLQGRYLHPELYNQPEEKAVAARPSATNP